MLVTATEIAATTPTTKATTVGRLRRPVSAILPKSPRVDDRIFVKCLACNWRSSPGGERAAWPIAAPLFVGADGEHHPWHPAIPVLRAFRRAGIDADRARGALVHGLRHTFATELANADVSVYTLMKLLGHESMVTSQRYVTAAGTETRTAAAQNKLYRLLEQER